MSFPFPALASSSNGVTMTDELKREPGESLIAYARRRAAALGIDLSHMPPPPESIPQWAPELIPDPGPIERSPQQLEIDHVLSGLDIIDAYHRWCGKMQIDPGSKRESILVSCPNPAHPDANPSAWLNLDKGDGGVGNCAVCGGFDKYDIAAWGLGFNVPDYKNEFPELRRRIAEELGFKVMTQGKDEWLEPMIQPQQTSEDQTPGNPVDVSLLQPVGAGTAAPFPTGNFEVTPAPGFNWRDLPGITPDTFLHVWLEATSTSYEPEEFYFWMGLQALGAAVGDHVYYEDIVPVRPNLMVCVIGSTGAGKSMAIGRFEELLIKALPFQHDTGGGVRLISSPGSGESLVDQFVHSYVDPSTGQKQPLPINGLYRESELALFTKRSSRQGNTVRELVMDFFDSPRPVRTASRTHGQAEARDHFMQMTTSTQPGSMGRLLTDSDAAAGFLNRWVFVWGKNKFRPARNAQTIDITPAIDPLQNVRAWSAAGRTGRFYDGLAADLWDAFYQEKVFPLAQRTDDQAWLTARMELLAKKVMLLLAINDRVTTIMVEHVETVIALWPYLLQCYGLVDDSLGVDELEECATAIEQYASARSGEAITFRMLRFQSAAKKYKREVINRALQVLVQGNILAELTDRKQRVTRYQYVDDAEAGPALATVTPIR